MSRLNVPSRPNVPNVYPPYGARYAATIHAGSPGMTYGSASAMAAPANNMGLGANSPYPWAIASVQGAHLSAVHNGVPINSGNLQNLSWNNPYYDRSYLFNPYNVYPHLNNPYTYPYEMAPSIREVYRGAPGECSTCCGGYYTGPSYYR